MTSTESSTQSPAEPSSSTEFATARTSSARNRSERLPLWVGRAFWSVGAQGLSSTTNFGLSVALLIAVSADELGRILAVISIYLLVLTLCRSVITEPLVAASGDTDPNSHDRTQSWPQIRNRVVSFAVAAMAASAVVGLVLNADPWSLAILIPALPVLLIQDAYRYRAMAADNHRLAATFDGVWLLASAGLLTGLALLASELSAATVVGAWVVGGVVSTALAAVLNRRRAEAEPNTSHGSATRPPDGSVEALDARRSGPHDRFRALRRSQVVSVIAVNLTPLLVAGVLSPTLAAAAKAVLIPFGVILSLNAGLRVVTLPAVRRAADAGRLRSLLARLLAALTATTAAASALIVAVANLVEPARLGDSFVLASPYLIWGAALCVVYVVTQQLADAAALSGHDDAPVRRMVGVALEWAGMLIGGGLAGLSGLVIGWLIGLILAALLWPTSWLARPQLRSEAAH